MRKKLVIIAILLLMALIFSISISDGYRPFERLTEEQLLSADILFPDGLEKVLTETGELRTLTEKQHGLKLGHRGQAPENALAEIALHAADGTDYILTLYDAFASLDGDCYRTERNGCRELYKFINEV